MEYGYDIKVMKYTPYLFFTGKGGVGKTSTACTTAVALADQGKQVLLVSTDPASNLQDVFEIDLDMSHKPIPTVPNLYVTNLEPEAAAIRYREDVVGPYRGKLPDVVIHQMEEQLSGSCTVEIATFNEFSNLLTDPNLLLSYDHIIFDTAPTGHTLRLLQLPNAWNEFLHNSDQGTTQGGLLAGLNRRKEVYKKAVETLTDPKRTTLILVTRPDAAPLKEAARASKELSQSGMKNQTLIINGYLKPSPVGGDDTAIAYSRRQEEALTAMPDSLKLLPQYVVPLVSYNVTGVEHVRKLYKNEEISPLPDVVLPEMKARGLSSIVDDIVERGQSVVFTMGKGGVGKTTIAYDIAIALAQRGKKVHLTTTDPATDQNHRLPLELKQLFTIDKIDPKLEVEKYREEILKKVRNTMDEQSVAYAEEELNSPCTEEIAVFRAFAEVVDRADEEIVVIDTAPSGHTLLLLDATQSYHREISNSSGEVPLSVQNLLPRLKNEQETAIVLVTLAENTPVLEAERLHADLQRAGILPKWWIINQSLRLTGTLDPVLMNRAANEGTWIDRVQQQSNNHFVILAWKPVDKI